MRIHKSVGIVLSLLILSGCKSVNCSEMKQQLDHELEEAQKCSLDAECIPMALGPSGCEQYLNRERSVRVWNLASDYSSRCEEGLFVDCIGVTGTLHCTDQRCAKVN